MFAILKILKLHVLQDKGKGRRRSKEVKIHLKSHPDLEEKYMLCVNTGSKVTHCENSQFEVIAMKWATLEIRRIHVTLF